MPEPSPSLLAPLYHLDGYRRSFTDAEFWAPFVSVVSTNNEYLKKGFPRSGLPGTFPTFIVADSWVVKFFGPLFDGLACYHTELAVSQLIHPPDFPVPALLASGSLFPAGQAEFPWPYLIYDYIPSLSLGEVFDQVSFSSRLALAHQLGNLLCRMHSLPIPASSTLPATWDSYRAHLTRLSSGCQSRHTAWGSLPPSLLGELPAYLLPPASLISLAPCPSLLHVDLTRDHLLGDLHAGDWRLRAIIDFGDALTGDPLYELVVLHLEIFDADPRLLHAFLAAYQPSPFHQHDFVHMVMTLTLLHPYDTFAPLFARHRDLLNCTSLSELATRLWDVSFPPSRA